MQNKQQIKQLLKKIIELELDEALEVEESLSRYKTEDDMKAESKYDTRGIEAGYLATAQAKRVQELKRDLNLCENMELKDFARNDEIALGALIEVKQNDQSKCFFISLVCGGAQLETSNLHVQVISVHSPLGKELIGLKTGDEFEMLIKEKQQHFQVLSVT